MSAPAGPPGEQEGTARFRSPGWQRAALLAGSTTALVTASLVGSALGFLNKAACRSGDWNFYLKQFQAHCYTDIYPLYFGEKLSAGKVPYTGHPVEYPVLIGAAMQAVAWLVRPISNPYVRGREVLRRHRGDADVVLARRDAGHRLPGRTVRRWTALGVALAPGLILAAFINWDLIAMGLVALGMAAWAAPPDGPGRGAARPGGGHQVLPAFVLSARCCCCACVPGACVPSAPPRRPPPSRGWRSTCQSRSPHRRAGAGSTR